MEGPVGAGRAPLDLLVGAATWLGLSYLLLPNLIVVPMSFGNSHQLMFPPDRFSLELYKQFFSGAGWMAPLELSLRVAIGSAVIALAIGVPAAYSLVRGRYPGKRLITMLLLSPVLVPIIVIALGFYLYFSKLGIVGSEWSLIIGHAVYTTPFVVVTCMAGLRYVDENFEHAAAIMGIGPFAIFVKVTLPLLRPTILAAGLFAFLMSMDEVVIAYFITPGGSVTLPVKMFGVIQWETPPILAAVSTILSMLSLVVCLVGAFLQGRR
jgi:putative spermidine/putrescine transport system permease protein